MFMKKKMIIFLTIFIVICFTIILLFFLFGKKQNTTPYKNTFIYDGKFSSISITNFKSAKNSLNEIKENLGITNLDDLKEIISNEYGGNKFYRFYQYYNGIRVYGNEVLVGTNGSAADYLYSNTEYIPDNVKDKEFKYTTDEVYEKIADKIHDDIKDNNKLKESGEKIYYKVDNEYVNAYLINVVDNNYLIDKTYIVSDDLEILASYNNTYFYSQNYVARTIDDQSILIGVETEDGENFKLNDTERNIKIIPYEDKKLYNIMNNKENLDNIVYKFTDNPDQFYVTIMNRVSKVYDFYKNFLGYKGMNNRNGEIVVIVGATILDEDGEKRSNNSCHISANQKDYIILTDGYRDENSVFRNIPILAGHEYTHGVIHSINNLLSSTVPQAINEGYADVMGILSESYHQKRLNFDNRDRNPINRDNNCPDCVYNTSEIGNSRDSHSYATILSHALYLMTQGENAINDVSKLSKLWYKSMYYLPSNANYNDVGNALVKSAKTLSFSQDEINKIIESLQEVGITQNMYFTHDNHDFCNQYRCGSIMENGNLYFYDMNNNPIKPDKITVYTYINSIDNLENKREYTINNNNFKINLPFNEIIAYNVGKESATSGYLIEALYKDSVKKIYINVCNKDKEESALCSSEINIYFDEIENKKEYDKEKENYTKQEMTCTISMNARDFTSNKDVADAIKDLNAQVILEYNSSNTEIKNATLQMNFKIDLSSSRYSEVVKNAESNYIIDGLKKEVKNNICGNGNYYYCDVIQKDNGFSVVASDSIDNLINYNDEDHSRNALKKFIEKRGFTCN